MISEFYIENIKCYGCRNTAVREAKKQELVKGVEINIETGKVILHHDGDDETVSRVKSRLYRKGYPEKGKNNKISSVKSYVSCAMGRMNATSDQKEIAGIRHLKI